MNEVKSNINKANEAEQSVSLTVVPGIAIGQSGLLPEDITKVLISGKIRFPISPLANT